jgi:hypothetical protein
MSLAQPKHTKKDTFGLRNGSGRWRCPTSQT